MLFYVNTNFQKNSPVFGPPCIYSSKILSYSIDYIDQVLYNWCRPGSNSLVRHQQDTNMYYATAWWNCW